MSQHLWLSLVIATNLGCASVHFRAPPSGVLPSGEPLAVREVTKARTSMVDREVGKVQYRTANGSNAGTASIYEQVPVTTYTTNWFLFQGENTIDDVDFYKIAGDAALTKKAQAYRSSGLVFTWLGIGLAVAGSGTTVGLSLADAGPIAWSGVVGLAAGMVLAFIGQYRLDPEHHAVNSVTAINTANAYNQRLFARPPPPAPAAPPAKALVKTRATTNR